MERYRMTEQNSAKEHLKDLLDLDSGLTEWEVEFIENMSKWKGDFSPKQIAMIYKIYEKNL